MKKKVFTEESGKYGISRELVESGAAQRSQCTALWKGNFSLLIIRRNLPGVAHLDFGFSLPISFAQLIFLSRLFDVREEKLLCQ